MVLSAPAILCKSCRVFAAFSLAIRTCESDVSNEYELNFLSAYDSKTQESERAAISGMIVGCWICSRS